MKTVLLTTAAFFTASALGGYGYEAIKLRQMHTQGFALALTDFAFEIIYAATFGMIGCLAGLIVGLVRYRLIGRSKTAP